jgi:hypothetical protein
VGQAAKAVVERKFFVPETSSLDDADRDGHGAVCSGPWPRRLIRSADAVDMWANHTHLHAFRREATTLDMPPPATWGMQETTGRIWLTTGRGTTPMSNGTHTRRWNTGSSHYARSSVTFSRPIKSSAVRCLTPGSIGVAAFRRVPVPSRGHWCSEREPGTALSVNFLELT